MTSHQAIPVAYLASEARTGHARAHPATRPQRTLLVRDTTPLADEDAVYFVGNERDGREGSSA